MSISERLFSGGCLPVGPGTDRCLTCKCSPAQPKNSQMAAATSLPVQTLLTSRANRPPLVKRGLRAASVWCNPETSHGLCTWVMFLVWAPSNRVICLGSFSLYVNRAGGPCGLSTASPCSHSSSCKHITKNLCDRPGGAAQPRGREPASGSGEVNTGEVGEAKEGGK